MDKKLEQERLVRLLQDRKATIEVQAMMQLLELRLDQVKISLMTAPMETVAALQGEAKAYQRLTQFLNRAVISPNREVG